MEYHRRIEAEVFLCCINITRTDYHDYITFLTKKVKFIPIFLHHRRGFVIVSGSEFPAIDWHHWT